MDAKRHFGKAWGAYTAKITALGFEKIRYEQRAFETLKATAEYIALQNAQLERDRLAAEIMVEPARYAAALEIYAISLKTLKRENANHQKRVIAQLVDKTSPDYFQDQAGRLKIRTYYINC